MDKKISTRKQKSPEKKGALIKKDKRKTPRVFSVEPKIEEQSATVVPKKKRSKKLPTKTKKVEAKKNIDKSSPKVEVPEQSETPRGVCSPWRKPVILFFGFEEGQTINVYLGLNDNSFLFDSIYPQPSIQRDNMIRWNIKFIQDGEIELLDNNRKYPYLFWEAKPKVSISQLFSMDKFLCFKSDEVGHKLDIVLERMGLNFQERCDMITYWLPSMTRKEFVKVTFINREIYEKTFPITIVPKPKDSIRLTMIFKPVDLFEEPTTNFESLQISKRNSFESSYIIEWGGIEID